MGKPCDDGRPQNHDAAGVAQDLFDPPLSRCPLRPNPQRNMP